MEVYFSSLAIIVLAALIMKPGNNETSKKRFVVLSMVVLGLVAAVRSFYVGIDTYQYYVAYQTVSYETSRYEVGFLFLIWLLNHISSNPQLLIMMSSAIIMISTGFFIQRYSKNPVLSICLFVTLLTYAYYLNLMRQALAVSVLMFSIPYLLDKKYLRYVIVVVLASTFHSSALVWLIFLPLSFVRFNKRAIACYMVVFVAAMLFPAQLWSFGSNLFGKYDDYLASKWAGGNALAAPIMALMDFLLLVLSCYFLRKRESGKTPDSTDFLLHGSTLLFIVQALASQVNIFQRLTTYFAIMLAVLVPNALSQANGKLRFLITSVIVIVSIAFFVIIMIYRPEWQGIVPYIPFWDV